MRSDPYPVLTLVLTWIPACAGMTPIRRGTVTIRLEPGGLVHHHSSTQSCNNAKVHTEPPLGTTAPAERLGLLPPRPDSTVTY